MSGGTGIGRDSRGTGEPSPDYDAMQREIRESQARIDGTLGALRQRFAKLAPRHLMEQTMNRMYSNRSSGGRDQHGPGDTRYDPHHTGMTARLSSVGDTVRSHPVPLAMIGIGLGWLALSGSGYDRRIAHSRTVHTVRDRAGDAAQYARDAFYSATDSVRHAAGQAYERTGDAMSGAADSVRSTGGRLYGGQGGDGGGTGHNLQGRVGSATGRFWDMVDDHPLVAGLLGVALGAALGASIPSTRYEDRWVGDYADEATQRAKQLAQEAMDRGTRAARAAVEAAKDEVGEAVSATATAASTAAKEEAAKPS